MSRSRRFIIYTVGGAKADVTRLLQVFRKYLLRAGGSVHGSIKQERVIGYWLSNDAIKLSPIVAGVEYRNAEIQASLDEYPRPAFLRGILAFDSTNCRTSEKSTFRPYICILHLLQIAEWVCMGNISGETRIEITLRGWVSFANAVWRKPSGTTDQQTAAMLGTSATRKAAVRNAREIWHFRRTTFYSSARVAGRIPDDVASAPGASLSDEKGAGQCCTARFLVVRASPETQSMKYAHSLCEDLGVQAAIRQFSKLLITIQSVTSDCIGFASGLLRNRTTLAAENLLLWKQLALFQERKEKARQTTAADRFIFEKLARLFDWCSALVIVKPATLISWHRAAFRRFLALEIAAIGKAQAAGCHQNPDTQNGCREPYLGPRAHG